MDRDKSLAILKKCLHDIESMPQEEFYRTIIERGLEKNTMMHAYELKNILNQHLANNTNKQYGDVFFKDEIGVLHIVDYVEFDDNNNCILSHY